MNWSQNNELFIKELTEGFAWQHLPLMFLRLNGLEVEMPDLEIRKGSIRNASKFFDSKDLIINGKRVEIKSRKEKFVSPSSFPYDTAIVDTVKKYDGRDDKPFAYIMVSRITGAMLWVPASKPTKWHVIRKWDRTRKYADDFYAIPKEEMRTMDSLVKRLELAKKLDDAKS